MPGLTTFTLGRFERARVPGLLASVPVERIRLRRQPGLAWGRHLGTSAGGRTLGADPARWAWLCSWDDEAAAARFHDDLERRLHPVELGTLFLRTVRARGRWAGREVRGPAAPRPEGRPSPADDGPATAAGPGRPTAGPLVVLTRARVRPARWRRFTAAVPPVDVDLARAGGLLRSVGVGEWPVLVQGTLSIWRDAAAMTAFSRTDAHRDAVRRTGEEGWYAEELFARFSVDRTQGTWDGGPPAEPGR